MIHKPSKQVRDNYALVRERLGCKPRAIGRLMQRGPLDPRTTFKWIHPNFAECVRITWSMSGDAYKSTPTYMRKDVTLYPIIHAVFGVAGPDIVRDLRDTTVSRIRHVVMWLLYANGMEIGDIGRALSKDYHSVAYCIRTYRARFEEMIGVETTDLRRLASNRQAERGLPPQVHGADGSDRAEAQA